MRIKVQGNLKSITNFNPKDEVSPEKAGLRSYEIDEIWESLEDLYLTGIYPGISTCIRKNGHIILKRAIGHAKGNGPNDSSYSKKILLTPDTPICLFSASKAITAMLIHLLAEQGVINLSYPVCYYIPEFAKNGKDKITISHLLCHRGGFPTLPSDIDRKMLFDSKKFVHFLCESKPTITIGKYIAYHAITSGFILGEIVKRTTNMDIRQYLQKYIQKPLGFRYFNYGASKKNIKKVALNYYTGIPLTFPFSTIAQRVLSAPWKEVVEISNDPRFLQLIIPSGNIVATADEVSKFYQLLLNKGTIDNIKIFSPETIEKAIKSTGKTELDRTMMIPMKYSLGMMLGNKPFGIYGTDTEFAFGHIGFMNIFTWADTARQITVAFLTTGKALFGPHIGPLVNFLNTISKLT